MAKGIYLDKGIQPDNEMLIETLGMNKNLWDIVLKYINDTFPKISTEWKFYGKAWGWSLVCKSGKKQLIYLTPSIDCFQSSFIFNDSARETARWGGFSSDVIAVIEAGKNNPAGGTFDFDIKAVEDLELIYQMLQIKFDNEYSC